MTGSYEVECLGESGAAAHPEDLSGRTVSALVPDASWGYATYPGTGYADGTFSIPAVPPGGFFVRMSNVPFQGELLAWTELSQIHLGGRRVGRADWTAAPAGTALDLQSSSTPSGSYAELVVPSLGIRGADASGSVSTGAWRFFFAGLPLLQGSRDPGFLVVRTSSRSGSDTLATIGALATLPALDLAGGAIAAVAVDPIAVTPGTALLDLSADADAFARALPGAPATAFSSFSYSLRSQPFGAVGAPLAGPTLLSATVAAASGIVSRSGLRYADPFPASWARVAIASRGAIVRYTSRSGNYVDVGFTTTTQHLASALPAGPLRPLVGPVLDLRVNGVPASTPGLAMGESPLFTWSPPSLGAPTGYVAYLYRLTLPAASGAPWVTVATIRTPLTSARLPAGILEPGGEYVLAVKAMVAGGYEPSHPARYSLPYGFAEQMSALLIP